MYSVGKERLREYDVETLRTWLKEPWRFRLELTKWATSINQYYYHQLTEDKSKKVFDKEWDTLILLDACRYDTFSKVNWIDGQLECLMSAGSQSWEFMEHNFVGQNHWDTVYVSANPFTSQLEVDTFHDIWHVYEYGWDSDCGTVPPEVMVEEAIKAHGEYPNKRIIIHMMQPHAPYLGERGNNLPHDHDTGDGVWAHLFDSNSDVSKETLIQAYEENLTLAIDQVKRLIERITGAVVISSDHGELFGERMKPIPVRGYEHHPHLHHSKLLEVPWFTVNNDKRKIKSERSIARHSGAEEETIKNRLRQLGYN